MAMQHFCMAQIRLTVGHVAAKTKAGGVFPMVAASRQPLVVFDGTKRREIWRSL